MKSMLLFGTTGSLIFFSFTFLEAQGTEKGPDQCETPSTPARDASVVTPPDIFWLWRNAQVTGGQLTLPFKIRRSPEFNTFRLTTDVTLGGYIGYTRRLTEKHDFFLTIPLTGGLTFINLTDSNTTLEMTVSEAEVIPGLTWSSGIIIQLDKYNIGWLFGKDYASNVGNQWEYHGKLWWSFGIGFVFLQ